MPLYSNTTTGNNQVTYTALEQVTKILPYDSAALTNWTSLPELSIPLGPHQRVIGTIEGWYDAVAGADLESLTTLNKNSTTLIFDNEPRNPITVRKITQAIDRGWTVFIPPRGYVVKDLNEAIQSGMNQGSLQVIVKTHSYDGMRAKLELSQWSL